MAAAGSDALRHDPDNHELETEHKEPYMDDKLTRKSQDALSAAVRRAAADGNPHVDPLHLLVALIAQNGGTAAPLLRASARIRPVVAKDAEARLGRLPRASGQTLSAPETSRPLLG